MKKLIGLLVGLGALGIGTLYAVTKGLKNLDVQIVTRFDEAKKEEYLKEIEGRFPSISFNAKEVFSELIDNIGNLLDYSENSSLEEFEKSSEEMIKNIFQNKFDIKNNPEINEFNSFIDYTKEKICIELKYFVEEEKRIILINELEKLKLSLI